MGIKYRIREDISPCIAKDRKTGVGVPLVPGGVLDFDEIGIDADSFLAFHSWAFEKVEQPSRRAKKKAAVEQATAAPGEER